MTTISTLAIRYELASTARDYLGPDARSIWADALATELERAFPGAELHITTTTANVDASRFDVDGITDDGAPFGGGNGFFSAVEIYDVGDSDLPTSLLMSIARRLTDADGAAWDRACEAI
jgi:hypothetical protein